MRPEKKKYNFRSSYVAISMDGAGRRRSRRLWRQTRANNSSRQLRDEFEARSNKSYSRFRRTSTTPTYDSCHSSVVDITEQPNWVSQSSWLHYRWASQAIAHPKLILFPSRGRETGTPSDWERAPRSVRASTGVSHSAAARAALGSPLVYSPGRVLPIRTPCRSRDVSRTENFADYVRRVLADVWAPAVEASIQL